MKLMIKKIIFFGNNPQIRQWWYEVMTLSELGFPLLTDEYHRPIHLEIEEYMRRYVSNDHDWEKVDDEDCWGMNYTEPTSLIKEKIETITRGSTGRD